MNSMVYLPSLTFFGKEIYHRWILLCTGFPRKTFQKRTVDFLIFGTPKDPDSPCPQPPGSMLAM